VEDCLSIINNESQGSNLSKMIVAFLNVSFIICKNHYKQLV
jgi:hypothetical protein